MNKKVTTSDISSRLGLSRNTVSKALNGHPGIPDKTKRKVVEAAVAMGYKKIKIPEPAAEDSASDGPARSIVYLTKSHLHLSSYWMHVMRGVEQVASAHGYEMKLIFVKPEDAVSLVPPSILNADVQGFIVGGALSADYTRMLIGLPWPKTFINVNPDIPLSGLHADVVMVENEDSTYRIARQLVSSGHRDIGFIGNISSCRSFMERWLGYQRAVLEAGLSAVPEHVIAAAAEHDYQCYEGVAEALSTLEDLPSAFVCANDIIALHAIRYLQGIGKKIPEDIAISGFDKIDEAAFLKPDLTSVSSEDFRLGLRAAEQLMQRLALPDRPYETVRLSSRIYWGESTQGMRPGN